MPIDYKKGKIYKIVNNENNKIYFGSTCQPLHKRMYQHRKKHNNCMSKKLGVDLKDCQIILVEKIECECKYELHKRERFYIENNECVNKRIPTRTKKEYYDKNKQLISEKAKEKYQKNKEHRLEQQKQYNQKNKQKIAEKDKQRCKIYREKNKLKIAEKAKVKMTCECGSVFRKTEKARHYRSNKHINFINCNPNSTC